jgi:hypothetical protein
MSIEETSAVPAWEYRKIALSPLPRKIDDIDLLCDAGEEGWELIAILPHNVAYLKRPLGDDADAHNDDETGRGVHEVPVKYLDSATNETWSGRGRMASWLKRKQDAGEDINKYLVQRG